MLSAFSAGDKSGQWHTWYRTAIPRAEQLYDDYLAERSKETSTSRWRDSGHLERAITTAGGQEAFDAALASMLDDARGWRLAEMRKRPRTGWATISPVGRTQFCSGMVAVSLTQISSTCSSARTSERRMLVTAPGSVSK